MRYEIIENFLTSKECQQIIQQALPRLTPSAGWSVDKGENHISSYRVSDQVFFQKAETELIADIEERISELVNIPTKNGEGMQVVRYKQGGHYYKHYDYFDPNFESNRNVIEKRGGQRILTVLMYLNTLEDGDGGATYFPELGLRIRPVEGTALIWWNVKENSEEEIDKQTIHAGEDLLTDKKEKWIATKWFRANTFV